MEEANIIIFDTHPYDTEALAVYQSLGQVFFAHRLPDKRRKRLYQNTKIVVIRPHIMVDKKFIDDLPALQVIASPTTGENHIDKVYAEEKGIAVITLKGRTDFLKHVTSTAEHTFALLLALVRHIPGAFDEVKRAGWRRDPYIGIQLKGKTFGIIGFGRLGKIVARYAKAFAMRVVACDPNVSTKTMKRFGVRSLAKSELLKQSDIVSLHASLDGAERSFTLNDFKAMKREAFFVNTSRAEIIQRDALYQALKSKLIAGAAIDVMDDERGGGGHLRQDPLFGYAKKYSNLLLSPHLGGMSREAMGITEKYVAHLVKKFLTSGKLSGRVK